MSITLRKFDDQWLVLTFPFTIERLEKVRLIPGRKWMPQHRCWLVPYTISVLSYMQQYISELKLDEGLRIELSELEGFTELIDAIESMSTSSSDREQTEVNMRDLSLQHTLGTREEHRKNVAAHWIDDERGYKVTSAVSGKDGQRESLVERAVPGKDEQREPVADRAVPVNYVQRDHAVEHATHWNDEDVSEWLMRC